MPHDRDGKLLEIGDTVTIEATVKEIYNYETHCNVQVETKEIFYGADYHSLITLNTKQVVKTDKKE